MNKKSLRQQSFRVVNNQTMKKILILLIASVLLLPACRRGETANLPSQGDTLDIRYAENLQIIAYPDYYAAVLRNPWDTLQTLHTYFLAPEGILLPDSLAESATVVCIPLRKAVVTTSVHCALIDELGKAQSIAGVCDSKYIDVPSIAAGLHSGVVKDLGNSMDPDIEQLIMLRPDAMLLSSFENDTHGRLAQTGIPLIECADYMETSPLGRAEWMRFYGLLFGCAEKADSTFGEVERAYKELAARAEGLPKPTLLAELKSSAWYVAGGKSTMGQLYADAGADYLFDYLDNSGSVPLSFEAVFDKAHDADVWIFKYYAEEPMTYEKLRRDVPAYAGFKAFRERKMWGCNTLVTPFYEETPFHPERLLDDLTKIFHPELANDTVFHYFYPLD